MTVPSVLLKLTTKNTTMDMTMSSIRPNRVEVVTSVQRRRRWTPEQKLEIVKQTNEPGSSVSLVARQHGLTAAQLFQWRKAYLEDSLVAVGANETVVPASELQEAMRRIKQLEGALGLFDDNYRGRLETLTGEFTGWPLPKALMQDWLET
jgi:transposase